MYHKTINEVIKMCFLFIQSTFYATMFQLSSFFVTFYWRFIMIFPLFNFPLYILVLLFFIVLSIIFGVHTQVFRSI